MHDIIGRLCADESGATPIEYGLIASFIGAAIAGAVKMIGTFSR
jgi:Flp pilus assembly pilin Flp